MKRSRLAAILVGLASLAAAPAPGWHTLDPANTLVIDTTKGRIVVDMHPAFAPLAVARVKLLAREHLYDGLLFHRVIDNYVDQTGNPNNHDGGVSSHPNLPPEFRTSLTRAGMDAIATSGTDGITGFVGSFPVAATPDPAHAGVYRAWALYCTGLAGMGRQADPSSANSEIFFMRAPSRALDHDYTPWGRVILGLDVIQSIAIGEPPMHPDRMIRVRLMADLPPDQQPHAEILATASPEFRSMIARARATAGADFSPCDLSIPARF